MPEAPIRSNHWTVCSCLQKCCHPDAAVLCVGYVLLSESIHSETITSKVNILHLVALQLNTNNVCIL